jgi:hypothetical protein
MDNEEMQEIWDLNLIHCWRVEAKTNSLILRFMNEVSPMLLKIRTFDQIYVYTNSKLRTRTIAISEINMPVRAFIANHSSQLSSYLWDNEFNSELVAEHIDNFKWFKSRSIDKKQRSIKQSEKRRRQGTKFISLRACSKNHDWVTVK